jgi:FAD/FMN-containing dehydrogenase
MMIGSRGGIGVVTAIHFKVLPARVEPETALYEFASSAQVFERVKVTSERNVALDWLELVRQKRTAWRIGLGYSGNSERKARIARDLERIWGKPSVKGPAPEPGSGRQTGFISALGLRGAWHLYGTYPTSTFLDGTACDFLGDAAAIVHPIGGDFHCFVDDESEIAHILERLSNQPGYLTRRQAGIEHTHPLPVSYRLMKALKNKLDPHGIFIAPFYDS